MTIEDKIKAISAFAVSVEGRKKVPSKMLERLLPVDEILVVPAKDNQVLVFSDVLIDIVPKGDVNDLLLYIKAHYPDIRHRVIRMSNKRYQELKNALLQRV